MPSRSSGQTTRPPRLRSTFRERSRNAVARARHPPFVARNEFWMRRIVFVVWRHDLYAGIVECVEHARVQRTEYDAASLGPFEAYEQCVFDAEIPKRALQHERSRPLAHARRTCRGLQKQRANLPPRHGVPDVDDG